MYVILLWTYRYFTANWQNKYEIVVVKNFLLCVESYFISRCYAISNDDDDIVVCDANVLLNPGYFYWQPQEIVVIKNVIVLLLAYTFYHPNFVVIIVRQHFLPENFQFLFDDIQFVLQNILCKALWCTHITFYDLTLWTTSMDIYIIILHGD